MDAKKIIPNYKFDWLYLSFMILFHGALFLIPWTFHWSYLVSAIILQITLGGIGICVGYHRLLTHRSFETPKWVEYTLATLGVLTLQGGPIKWVATHRKHHHFADKEDDPHSPNHGFFWSHMLWIFKSPDDKTLDLMKERYAKDLLKSSYYRFLDKYNFILQIAFGLICFFAGGWKFLVWGMCVRLVFSYHTTWFVNSAAHTFGYRNFLTKDRSTNCWWVALLTYGEGWHNNHHALPSSAKHGMRRFEIDFSYWTIWSLKIMGLARNVKVPSKKEFRNLMRQASEKITLVDPSQVVLVSQRRARS
jgi:fatty-acid desaturase